jgi:hypothetical protein
MTESLTHNGVNVAPVTDRDFADLIATLASIGHAVATGELPRELRIARHAYITSLRVDEGARRGSIALGRWADRYLNCVMLDDMLDEREPSDQTLIAREYALAIMRALGLLPPGTSTPLPVGVVDPDIAAFVGEDGR